MLLRFIAKRARSILGNIFVLSYLEKYFLKDLKKYHLPPLFLIGPPRTGSTFLYQLLAYFYRCSYFTNLSSLFYTSPTLITHITKKFFKRYEDKCFYSNYGLIKGIWAPSEAGAIFNHWFSNKNNYKKNKKIIRKTCYKIAQIFGEPFISKNLNNSMRLKQLFDIFPEAIFVHVKRNITYTCQSIIVGLRKGLIRVNPGSHIGTSNLDIFERSVEDVIKIERLIETFFTEKKCNYITINYSNLCSNYEYELLKIEEIYNSLGYELIRRKNFEKIKFKKSERIILSNDDWYKLKKIVHSKIKKEQK